MAAVNKAFSVLVSLCVLLTLASANRHLTEKKAGDANVGVLDRKEVEPQGVGVGIGIGSGPREGASRSGVDCGGGGSVIQIPGVQIPGVQIPGISIGMPGGSIGGCGGVPQIPYPIYVPGPGGCTTVPPCMPGFGQDQPGGAGAAKLDAHDQQPIVVAAAAAKEDAVKTATPVSN